MTEGSSTTREPGVGVLSMEMTLIWEWGGHSE